MRSPWRTVGALRAQAVEDEMRAARFRGSVSLAEFSREVHRRMEFLMACHLAAFPPK